MAPEDHVTWVKLWHRNKVFSHCAHHHRANGNFEIYQGNLIYRITYSFFEFGDCWSEHVEKSVAMIREMIHKLIEKTLEDLAASTL